MVMSNPQREPALPPPIPITTGNQPSRTPPEAQERPQEPSLDQTPPEASIGPRTVIACQNSSMVHSFEYNRSDQTLRVYFRGGQTYDYFFVPSQVADEFKVVCDDPTESAGKWFAKNVRRTFEFQKVG